ncbi:MAG: BtrH N-terminal domain-containing protein [Deltaproteobacteria bacterium]|nr:BtrH N-terminal domain-containing protein [Deltaproteobacteria bacterium]
MNGGDLQIPFRHRQAAHCESGTIANLLSWAGLEISEALAFGIGGGLFFGYFPFVRINRLPLVTFRKAPGAIFKKVVRRLGVNFEVRKFRDPEESMAALDAILERGIPVGVQTGVFWLPYFPPALRFHFNAHNLVVMGREGGDYLVSDPLFDVILRCPRRDLMTARFAKGALAPQGRMYYLEKVPERVDLAGAVRSGLGEVVRVMLSIPLPIIGIRGIRFLARQLEGWPARLGERKTVLYLGHVIRMQEEIGTGGAGFRFIFGAFLQEAAELLDNPRLAERSREATEVGDRWRDFALQGARFCKGRDDGASSPQRLAALLRGCADGEERLFRGLRGDL